MKIKNLEFPTKKRWLKNWWQKNINIFSYATENPEIKRDIEGWRAKYTNRETSTTPKGLYKILKRIFVNDLEWKKQLLKGKQLPKEKQLLKGKQLFKKWNLGDCTPKREGDKYYLICKNKNGKEDKWRLSDSFLLFDDETLVPWALMELVEMLSNIHEEGNRWILEPQPFVKRDKLVFGSPPFFDAFHRSYFLKDIKYMLQRLNLDYFIFWPLFFFYALTNDIEFTIKNATFFFYPIKLFLVIEFSEGQRYLVFRLYGDCNFNEILNFFKDNKKRLDRLNKLMGNPNISSRTLKGFLTYKDERKPREIALSQIDENSINNLYLKALLREAKRSNDPAYKDALPLKKITQKKVGLIKTIKSQVKREIQTITEVPFNPEIGKLINEINNPKSN